MASQAVRHVIAIVTAASTGLLVAPLAQADPAKTGKSTLDRTIVKQGNGFQRLTTGAGEGYKVRKAITTGKKHRAHRRRSLAFFGQLTDPQLVDEMSPTRTELVDPASGPIAGAWRPQEALGARVFDSIVRSMNANRISRVAQGDGRRAQLGFTILTGDIADSAQFNEVNWFRDLLEGKRVVPYSGKRISAINPCPGATQPQIDQMNAEVRKRQYVGVQNFDAWVGQNLRYAGFWDPDEGGSSNEYGYGAFPRYPGLMNAGQAPLNTAGLNVPWYITRGNHDALVQGNVPANLSIAGLPIGSLAVGCRKPWPNNLLDPNKLIGIPSEDVFSRLTQPDMLPGVLYGLSKMRPVAPDPDRRYVSKLEFKQEMGKGDNRHGFGYVSKRQLKDSNRNATYYAFTKGKFRIIMLDTNAEGGGASGNVDNPQYRWLRHQLDRYSTVEVKGGKLVRDEGRNKLLVIASHHTLGTMDNPTPDEAAGTCSDPMEPGCDSDPRLSTPLHLGMSGKQAVLPLLLRYPNVVAYVNGHTHHNALNAFQRKGKGKTSGGFWQVNTASHVDWPQQSRTIEFMDNKDNTLSIFGTILNSAAPVKSPKPGTNAKNLTNAQLASLSRRIAANDPQTLSVTDGGGPGRAKDRNAEMLLKDPRRLWKPKNGLG